MRPVILNGIEALADRGDLADRSIVIALSSIGDKQRRDEATFWADFERERPQILGAILDAVSGGLRRLSATRLERMPRMADFARWIVAAAPDLGFTSEAFLKAYTINRSAANEVTLESSLIAAIIIELAEQGWTGTATVLLRHLESKVDEIIQRRREFPHSTKALHGALVRLAPHLRQVGVEIHYHRDPGHQRTRRIVIRKIGRDLSDRSDLSEPNSETSDGSTPEPGGSTPPPNGSVRAFRMPADSSDTSDASAPISCVDDVDVMDVLLEPVSDPDEAGAIDRLRELAALNERAFGG